jgi:hypothetical protein
VPKIAIVLTLKVKLATGKMELAEIIKKEYFNI